MPRSLLKALSQFLATALIMWALLFLPAKTHSFVYIWPLTGIHLAMVLGDWKQPRERYLQLFAGTAGIATAGVLLRLPWFASALFAAAHCSGVWLAATILSRYMTRFDQLKQRKSVLRFGAVATVVPMLSRALVAVPLAVINHSSLLITSVLTTLADSAGIAIMTPAVLFLVSGEISGLKQLQPQLKLGIPSAIVSIAVTTMVFSQNGNPFLFMVFPAMVVTLFLFGLEGATFVTVTVAAIACWQTAHGHGPVWVMRNASMEHRIIVLQTFLWVIAAVALPVGALQDERRSAEVRASENGLIYRTLLENSDEMIVLSTLDGSRRFVSPGVRRIIGWDPEEYLALPYLAAVYPDDHALVREVIKNFGKGQVSQIYRHRMVHKDGEERWVEVSATGYSGPDSDKIIGYVATIRDISALKDQQDLWISEKADMALRNETLADLAATDELTGIGNRRTFNRTLDYEAARHARSGQSMSLLMIDVDQFKLFNDVYGHQAGDDCLRRLAEVFQASVGRVSDAVARVGGEEFAVILPGTDGLGARRVAEDIVQKVRGLRLKHHKSTVGVVTVSIGVATWPPFFSTEVAELIEEADKALYETKKSGRNGISVSKAFPGVPASQAVADPARV